MATIAATKVEREDRGTVITWGALSQVSADVGNGVFIGDITDISVQAVGTSTNTVAIQGSNDNVHFEILGAGLTLTIAAGGQSPVQPLPARPLYIRPGTPSAGVNTIVTVGGRRPF